MPGRLARRPPKRLGPSISSRTTTARGTAAEADAVVATDTATLPELLWRDQTVERAERAGTLTIEGNHRAARRLLGLFGAHA